MRIESRSDVALYVWDYFFISNVPREGDEKCWAAIERAVCRVRESDAFLDPPTPTDIRLRHAERVRNSVRVARRQIERLSATPEGWVIDRLAELEAFADGLITELRKKVAGFPLS